MSIDMAQFHQVFFEESFEGLDIMESGLLNLDMGDVDSEAINTIFRAAHSIKGGSGTFGFSAVSDYTHVMETLLDEMRDGRRQVTQSAVDVLLGSVDCLREMLSAIQDEKAIDAASVAEHKKALELELNGEQANSQAVVEMPEQVINKITATPTDSSESGWKISFCPHTDLLKTGNDPVRMFRELSELGDLEVIVDLHGVPSLFDLDPEECHLSWTLILKGNVQRAEIDDIFDWVEDECDLSIQALNSVEESIESAPTQSSGSVVQTNPASSLLTQSQGSTEPKKDPTLVAMPVKTEEKKANLLLLLPLQFESILEK